MRTSNILTGLTIASLLTIALLAAATPAAAHYYSGPNPDDCEDDSGDVVHYHYNTSDHDLHCKSVDPTPISLCGDLHVVDVHSVTTEETSSGDLVDAKWVIRCPALATVQQSEEIVLVPTPLANAAV